MAVKFLRIIFFFLIAVQAATWCYRNSLPAIPQTVSALYISHSTGSLSSERTSPEAGISEVLYSPEKLQLPDALLSPIPSFQFGLIEVLACFLFVIFSFCTFLKVRETVLYFTNAYFHTLFLSVILINAP
jgi:hypothetical protein